MITHLVIEGVDGVEPAVTGWDGDVIRVPRRQYVRQGEVARVRLNCKKRADFQKATKNIYEEKACTELLAARANEARYRK